MLVCLIVLHLVPAHAAGTAAIASAHPLATEAGFEILRAGGNAFDAAVAVAAALAVVEPYGSGLGGGGFFLLHRAQDGFEVMLDARETAPGKATTDMYLDRKGAVIPGKSLQGPLAAGIPGTPAALAELANRYGRLPLSRSLAPAIRYAREGFEVSEHYCEAIRMRLELLRGYPQTAAIFLRENAAPSPGYRLRQPELAGTLEEIAADGAAGFYRGKTARRLLDAVRAGGGIWRARDLEDYRVLERAPLRGEYRGMRITTAPPPSSGGVVLLTTLNILGNFELSRLPEPQHVHLIVEAMRRAYRDRAEYLGDPDFVKLPLEKLLHPFYAAGLAASIRLDRATPSAALPGAPVEAAGNDTTHFSIIDDMGNRVGATLSINFAFGSGFVATGTGVLLNNEMDDFAAAPGVPNGYGLIAGADNPNRIEPGKRMLSSMTPAFLEQDGRVAVLGTPGGSRIISMVLLSALAFHEGAAADRMTELPRFHHQFIPDHILYEATAFTPPIEQALRAFGHPLVPSLHPYGNMQVVILDTAKNILTSASDPRGEGLARVAIGSDKPLSR
ncbi:MAG TPA: gamma-glutamyltransferase [Gammaproteobacteria bacterium]|nr:gamma-glutamyltransferase [Gammaproteobacteria bacterium]